MKVSGRHYFCVLKGCGRNAAALDSTRLIKAAATQAIKKAGMTLFAMHAKRFTPQGITLLAIIGESHVSLHTYPEHSTCVVDILTCGKEGSPAKAVKAFQDFFRPAKTLEKRFTF